MTPNWKDFFPFTRLWTPTESVVTCVLAVIALVVLVFSLLGL